MPSTPSTTSASVTPNEKAPPVKEAWKKANSTKDTDSLAPLVNEDGVTTDHERRKSWFQKLTPHHNHDPNKPKEKKKSIADSGPFIFVYSPALGKEVLMKNPHWPNEDSWKREKEAEGQWAFGSMMGQQNVDFGGTV
jgi:hypothetical protein